MPQSVNVWGDNYIIYNLEFPSFIQSGETMSESNDYMDSSIQETVTEHVDSNGKVVKVITSGQKTCEQEQVVEIFEDRKVLTKRVTEFVKPVVYKIKTEMLDACGNVVDVIITELDDSTTNMSASRSTAAEPVLAAQSVVSPVPVKHVTKSYREMMALTRESSHFHRHGKKCQDCGSSIED